MNFSSRIVIGLVAIKAEEAVFFLMFFQPVYGRLEQDSDMFACKFMTPCSSIYSIALYYLVRKATVFRWFGVDYLFSLN